MRPAAVNAAPAAVPATNTTPLGTSAATSLTSRWGGMLVPSEETRDLINRTTEYAKRTLYYGWIPFILLLGTPYIDAPFLT